MKAMVLAAGLGTRLRPLTDFRPKALVEVAGRTLLEINLTRLKAFGVREAIVNAHHFADMIAAYLKVHTPARRPHGFHARYLRHPSDENRPSTRRFSSSHAC